MENQPGDQVAYGIPAINEVVDNVFCAPNPVELIIKRKYKGFLDSSFQVFDVNGSLFFQVVGCNGYFLKKKILRYPGGYSILTMREKALSSRERWTVHQGESSERNDLLFSVRKSHVLQVKPRLEVFLADNVDEDMSNFQVVGCYSSLSCKIYKGDAIIAKVNHSFTLGGFFTGKDKFRVIVYPGVDYAFIVALIVILAETDDS